MTKLFSAKLSRKRFIIYNTLLFSPIIFGAIIEILFGGGAMMGISVIDFLIEITNQYVGVGAAGIMLFSLFIPAFWMSKALVILGLLIYSSLLVRRINDIGINPAITLLILIPFLSILLYIWLLIKKGE